jgi:hypothetical protein
LQELSTTIWTYPPPLSFGSRLQIDHVDTGEVAPLQASAAFYHPWSVGLLTPLTRLTVGFHGICFNAVQGLYRGQHQQCFGRTAMANPSEFDSVTIDERTFGVPRVTASVACEQLTTTITIMALAWRGTS